MRFPPQPTRLRFDARLMPFEGRQMPEYQAYLLGPDGHIQSRIDLHCADDEAAIERAKQLVDGQVVELWQSGRRITTFKAKHLGPR